MKPIWFALRTFNSDPRLLQAEIVAAGQLAWVPTRRIRQEVDGNAALATLPLVPNVILVQSTDTWLRQFVQRHPGQMVFYTDASGRPLVLPEGQVKELRQADIAKGDKNLTFLGRDMEPLRRSIPVTITGGPFAGISGHYARIASDRSILLPLQDVALIKLPFIPESQWTPVQ